VTLVPTPTLLPPPPPTVAVPPPPPPPVAPPEAVAPIVVPPAPPAPPPPAEVPPVPAAVQLPVPAAQQLPVPAAQQVPRRAQVPADQGLSLADLVQQFWEAVSAGDAAGAAAFFTEDGVRDDPACQPRPCIGRAALEASFGRQ